MEENITTTEQQTQAGTMGNETEVQGKGREPKMFTQKEVNSFVQGRISRMKGQIAKDAKAEYEQRMQELQAREMKLLVKERLYDRGMPKRLADIITCTDENDLNAKLDALQEIYGGSAAGGKEKPTGFIRVGAPSNGSGAQIDPVRQAMGL